jgi:hypothetical protein
LLQNSVFASFKQNKPIGASPLGQFLFFGGEGGVWAKKVVTLRGLRISEKKEILRKLTVHTFILFYLLYQIFLGRFLGRNSLHTDDRHRQTPTDDSLIFSSIGKQFPKYLLGFGNILGESANVGQSNVLLLWSLGAAVLSIVQVVGQCGTLCLEEKEQEVGTILGYCHVVQQWLESPCC